MATLDYWMGKAKVEKVPKTSAGNINMSKVNPTKWYYDVRMAHSSLHHEIEVTDDKIYEETFPIDWNEDGVPTHYVSARERTRLMNISESNIYNIT